MIAVFLSMPLLIRSLTSSNIVFKDQVGDEIIPGEEHNFLVAGLNPAESIRHYSPLLFRYERNKKSLAYIAPHTKGKYHYFLGGLNGGRTPEYLKMCETLAHNIRIDYDNGIVAIYHDESHINRYFRDYPPLALGKEFGVFEGWNMDIKCKLIFRDKTKVSDSFKKNKVDPFSKVIRFCRRIWSGIKWNLWL